MRSNNKKGISPIIATVILVGLVVILGLAFFLFARNQIAAQTEKIECGSQEEFSIDISASCSIINNPSGGKATSVVLSNKGSDTIDGMRIICTHQDPPGGATSPPATPLNCKTGEDCTVDYNYECDTVEVLPGVVKENDDKTKFVLCTDKSVTVQCE